MANYYYYYTDDELQHSLHSALRKTGAFIKKLGINVRTVGRKTVASSKKNAIKLESKAGFLKTDGASSGDSFKNATGEKFSRRASNYQYPGGANDVSKGKGTTSSASVKADADRISTERDNARNGWTTSKRSEVNYTANYKAAKERQNLKTAAQNAMRNSPSQIAAAGKARRRTNSSSAAVSRYRSQHPRSKLSDSQILRNAGYR